ncbi:MAG: site-specific integrase [Actinobacteria bacterium]|nr:site-specific integrase [Actinomycetota bacterium]
MASIYKRYRKDGTARYVVRFNDPYGNRTEKIAGSTKKAAESLKISIERELAAGTYGQKAPEDPIFMEFCEDFLKAKKSQVKPSTHEDYKQVVENHIKPFFKKKRISAITPILVQNFLSYLEEKNISPGTRRKIYRYLKVIIHHAQTLEIIARDPTMSIRSPRVEKKEMACLTPDEVSRLLEAADDYLMPLLAVACFAGLRQGEILGLKWGDVDFTHGNIRVVRTYDQDFGFSEPKSKSSRRAVPIPQFLVCILKRLHEKEEAQESDELVFPNSVGKPRDRRNLITRGFENALTDAGIRRIRFHDLRHTYASLCIAAGMDPKALQRAMGHASISMTMDTYAHLFPGSYERPLARLEGMFSSQFNDDPSPE